jgi:hypothetical protein
MPRIMQSLWIGETLGTLHRLSIASFLHFGDAYHLYCYGEAPDAPAGVTLRDGNEILPESAIFCYQRDPDRGNVAAFSNLFRYRLLLERGGWWVDTDVVCLRPFDFPEEVIFSSEDTRGSSKVASAVIKLPAGHTVARQCYEQAERQDRRSLEWGQIGPDLLDRVVRRTKGSGSVKRPGVFCPVPWWRWDCLLAPDPGECLSHITEETYAVHLWYAMWRRAGMDRQAALPRTSYCGQLLQRYRVEV